MRLNRETLLLLLGSLVVILVVALLSGRDGESATASPTPVAQGGGPLLPEMDEADEAQLVALGLRDNASGGELRLTRIDEGWAVEGPAEAAEREVDHAAAQLAIADALALAANASFEIEELAQYGLDAPSHTIEFDSGADALDLLFVGKQNPQGTRYYVMLRRLEIADGEAPTAPDLAAGATVLLVNSGALERITDLLDEPPWLPLPTATATPTATLNPMSEVEMATATAEAAASATAETETALTAVAEAQAAPEATPSPEDSG